MVLIGADAARNHDGRSEHGPSIGFEEQNVGYWFDSRGSYVTVTVRDGARNEPTTRYWGIQATAVFFGDSLPAVKRAGFPFRDGGFRVPASRLVSERPLSTICVRFSTPE